MKTEISIKDSVALISGANRGIGKAITEELLNRGIKKVYAGARQLESLKALQEKYGARLKPLQLDVTNQESVDNAVKVASDATMLINNAGVMAHGGYKTENMLESIHLNMEVNVLGVIRLTQAALPNIENKPNATIATVSSVVGLGNMPMMNGYCTSKAAVHSMIQGLRGELQDSNVLVSGIYPGPIETDMAKGFEGIELDKPENLAKNVVSALEQGEEDIFPDVMSAQIKQVYGTTPKEVEKMFSTWK
ncbi:MAG: SDR family NAD(P)-dependent oxidoreductase [Flavobacteriaceae bacterium]|nr:SDR family NAD(P)-dependent oxidoreductase [Flavobacteriaceae bacterium]